MSRSEELKAKAAHYRELATMLDPETAEVCRSLARQYEEEAAAEEARQRDQIIQNRIS